MNLPDNIPNPGADLHSPAKMLGHLLRQELANNPNFYLFSPDETTSNKLEESYESSARAWNQPEKPWDKHQSKTGHIIELLSENTLFAVLAGHILSGGQGALTSYEAFLPIISSQLDQHLKFLHQSKTIKWRPKYSALNLLSTSAWQRQDHNGYTHQNPALISTLLAKPSNLTNCLFPCDDIATTAAWEFMTRTKNVVNLTTFNKIDQPRWIDINHARFQLTNGGASILGFASEDNPDLILASIGDIPTAELLAARQIIKKELPHLRIRTINIAALSHAAIGTTQNKLKPADFDHYFTPDKPILINSHTYPETIHSILSHYTNPHRLTIHGYQDQGSTTTPLEMLTRNNASRYNLAISIFNHLSRPDLTEKYQTIIDQNTHHAQLFGTDKY